MSDASPPPRPARRPTNGVSMPNTENDQAKPVSDERSNNAAGMAALFIPPAAGFVIGGGAGGVMAAGAGLAAVDVLTQGVFAGGFVGAIVGLALGVPASLVVYLVNRRK